MSATTPDAGAPAAAAGAPPAPAPGAYAAPAAPGVQAAAAPAAPAPAPAPGAYAQVLLDIPAKALESPFTYLVPPELAAEAKVGCTVLVNLGSRPALGYVVGLSDSPSTDLGPEKLKPIRAVLSTPYFSPSQLALAEWIAREYMAPLNEAIRLLTPPGSTPRLKRDAGGSWGLEHPGVGPVDDRWVRLTPTGRAFKPRANAIRQRAILGALAAGELKVSELGLVVENATASLKSLTQRGLVLIESRRRMRGQAPPLPPSQDIAGLTDGQREALGAIQAALAAAALATDAQAAARQRGDAASQADEGAPAKPTRPMPILLDGVTGSGKTEVYLQAIRGVLSAGGSAIVLVPEISLTPQTVARFRARFGDQVAVLHSRLSPGERFDQWDMLRLGQARVAVGARSALFAPVQGLRLIIIDEEHESTYKQGSSPRYVSRNVAARLAELSGAVLVLGSATPSMESLAAVKRGRTQLVSLPERPNHRPLPPIQVVDLSAEFKSGNKTMFSTALADALQETVKHGDKAVLLLNRRGFASFMLCRDCGYVPMCMNCSTSLTFHSSPPRLVCHHCGAGHAVPAKCPDCQSPYLRQLGPGTQQAYDQLVQMLPEGTPVVRMDADSTRGRYGHERRLDEFAAAEGGVLLGTQMIAKGLDFPEVTLVGVLIADTGLKLPDFRAAERTYQLLEQVAGRAGRAERDGRVIVQTYWPEHLAIQAAAARRRDLLLAEEERLRGEFSYPPYARLANILTWGEDLAAVTKAANTLADALHAALPLAARHGAAPDAIRLLGPSPCVISRRQRQHRWHMLVKAPLGFDLAGWLSEAIGGHKSPKGVNRAIDIDPYDLM